jgi:hypothetical protein
VVKIVLNGECCGSHKMTAKQGKMEEQKRMQERKNKNTKNKQKIKQTKTKTLYMLFVAISRAAIFLLLLFLNLNQLGQPELLMWRFSSAGEWMLRALS